MVDVTAVTRLAARGALVGGVLLAVGFVGFALDGTLSCAGTGCGPPSSWGVLFGIGLFLALGGATVATAGKLLRWATRPR